MDQIWRGSVPGIAGEIHAAAFNGEDTIILATEAEESNQLALCAYGINEERITFSFPLEEPVGTLMPVGGYVVGFFEHPKLFNLKTGKIEYRWDEIMSGDQNSSIIWHHKEKLPSIALDSQNKRFAVAGPEEITVIQLG